MGPSEDLFNQPLVVPPLNRPLVNKSLVWFRWDVTHVPLLQQWTSSFCEGQRCLWRAALSVCLLFRRSEKLSVWDEARWGKSWAGSARLQISRWARPPYVWEQVRVAGHLVNVDSVLFPVGQAASYEGLKKKVFLWLRIIFPLAEKNISYKFNLLWLHCWQQVWLGIEHL